MSAGFGGVVGDEDELFVEGAEEGEGLDGVREEDVALPEDAVAVEEEDVEAGEEGGDTGGVTGEFGGRHGGCVGGEWGGAGW